MKTRQQILAAVAAGRTTQCLDGRDYNRLARFFPVEDYKALGLELAEGVDPTKIPAPFDLTEENVKSQLKGDLEFAFEKALNKRGISAGLMHEVIKMWMWVLDDELLDLADANYAQYGLPFFKMVAVKYGLENPIGDDEGTEDKYSSEG